MSDDSILATPLRALMRREVIAIGPEEPLGIAATAMLRAGVRHLPVVTPSGEVVGIISERDLRSRLGTELPHWIRGGSQVQELVGNAMTPDPLVLRTDHTLQKALEVFEDERVGAIVVLDRVGRLAGIVSYVDVLDWTHHRLAGPGGERRTPASPTRREEELPREITGRDASPAEANLGSIEPPDGQRADLTLGVRDLEEEPEASDLMPDAVEVYAPDEEEAEELTAQPSERPREERAQGEPPEDERPGF